MSNTMQEANMLIGFYSVALEDLEKVRIANENRFRTMVETDPDQGGWGLDANSSEVTHVQAQINGLQELEKNAVKSLETAVKKHPVHGWIKAQKGLGNKQVGRLLAALGNLTWNETYEKPRTVSQLWAYCGLHTDGEGISVQRKKGQQSNWSTVAKSRAYLIAESCKKQLTKECKTEDGVAHAEDCKCSPYRVVYDKRKAATAERVHARDCVRCGPSGKPAKAGSPWGGSHREADALRIVSKTIIKDLFREAKNLI